MIHPEFDRLYDLCVGALREGGLYSASDFIEQMEDWLLEFDFLLDHEAKVTAMAMVIACDICYQRLVSEASN